jgi:hypothetical protein
MYEKHRLECATAKYRTQPRRIGLICAITLADGPGPVASENLLELLQQRCPLLQSRGTQRHPSVSPTANPTKLKTKKSEALALREVHPPSFLLVHLDLEYRQLLAEAPFHRRTQPLPSRVSIDEDHQVIGEAGVFDARVVRQNVIAAPVLLSTAGPDRIRTWLK